MADDYNILLIEEPEAHLHPAMQYQLFKYLQNLEDLQDEKIKNQIIITTHSPNISASSNIDDIISFKKYNELTFINCACPLLEGCSLLDDGKSKRKEIKELIKKLKKTNKNIETNIFTSMNNVNLECVLGYRKGDEKHSFLDDYEE